MRPTVKLGTKFWKRAARAALRVHADDTRKGSARRTSLHLLGVASLVLMDGGSEDEAVAALLHDTLEDHPEDVTPAMLARRFGARVRDIVELHRHGAGLRRWREGAVARAQGTLRRASRPRAPQAPAVALTDKLYNARDLLADVRREGAKTSKRFNAGPADQVWYLRSARARAARGADRCDHRGTERVVADLAPSSRRARRRSAARFFARVTS